MLAESKIPLEVSLSHESVDPMLASARALEMPDLDEVLRDASSDLLPELHEVVSAGWTVDGEGATLLRAFLASYHGERDRFSTVTAYEAVVNGRAIPDIDLVPSPVRVSQLIRRGVAFVKSALEVARRAVAPTIVLGYVIVSPVLMDPENWVGTVTFCSRRTTESPYIADVQRVKNAIVLQFSSNE